MANALIQTGAYFAGQKSVLESPRIKQAGRRPVIYLHGATANALSIKGQLGFGLARTVRQVADLGYTVLATDLGASTTNWGNDSDFMPRMDDTYTNLVTRGLISDGDPVHLLAASMGTVGALRWAQDNPTKVDALAAMIPAYDMQAHRVQNVTLRSQIDAAYSVTYPAALPAGVNPPDFIEDLVGILDFVCWYSSNDESAFVDGAQDLAEALGGTATSLGPLGHTDAALGAVPALDIATFFAAHD